MNVAVVLGDYEEIDLERPFQIVVKYGLRYGSEEMVRRLLQYRSTLRLVDRIAIDRLPLLLKLGAKLTKFPYPEHDIDQFIELVKAGYIEINTAIAAVLRTDKEELLNDDPQTSKESLLHLISTVNPDAISKEKVRESLQAYFDYDRALPDYVEDDTEDPDDYIEEMLQELDYLL